MDLNNTPRSFRVEVCVDSYSKAYTAEKAGADQIELCSSLHLDGLSPSVELINACLENLSIRTKVMVRPISGSFRITEPVMDKVMKEIRVLKNIGVEEVVFGFISENDTLDIEAIQKVAEAAYPMDITIHKAIDYSKNPLSDIQLLKKISSIKSILTSGCAPTALDGVPILQQMAEAAGNEIEIIAAGKINPSNLKELHSMLEFKCYHGKNILGDLEINSL